MADRKKQNRRKGRSRSRHTFPGLEGMPPFDPCSPSADALFSGMAAKAEKEVSRLRQIPEQDRTPRMNLMLAGDLIIQCTSSTVFDAENYKSIREAYDILTPLKPQYGDDPLWLGYMSMVCYTLPEHLYECVELNDRLKKKFPNDLTVNSLSAGLHDIMVSSATHYSPENLPVVMEFIRSHFGEPSFLILPDSSSRRAAVLRCTPDSEHPYQTLMTLGVGMFCSSRISDAVEHEVVMFFSRDLDQNLFLAGGTPETALLNLLSFLPRLLVPKNPDLHKLPEEHQTPPGQAAFPSGPGKPAGLDFTRMPIVTVLDSSPCILPDGRPFIPQLALPIREEEEQLSQEDLEYLVRTLPPEQLISDPDRPPLPRPGAAAAPVTAAAPGAAEAPGTAPAPGPAPDSPPRTGRKKKKGSR